MVESFQQLAGTPFANGVNALCWPRWLPGDFHEVAARLHVVPGINALDESVLEKLQVGANGQTAIAVMLEDLRQLRGLDLSPELNCIEGSVREEQDGALPTDVYSFHADSATVEADTWLCTYLGATSEGLRNDEALRHTDIPETRAKLLHEYGGEDEEGFLEYLNENFYDLHYQPLPNARPFSFGIGKLWRVALEHPGCPVPPCIHRAPITLPGEARRLLLIS